MQDTFDSAMPSQSRGETVGGRGEQRKAQDQVEHDYEKLQECFVEFLRSSIERKWPEKATPEPFEVSNLSDLKSTVAAPT